jgi:uncharacterized Ntn-hydrolase superfamily protein
MTFSIVARDPETGAFGVACATGGPVVGSLVPHAAAGIGAIATQGNTNAFYAFEGLALLADPEIAAPAVLSQLVAGDTGRDRRQCIMVDREGRTAAWTGPACGRHAGALTEPGVAVAGNMLSTDAVPAAMLEAYRQAQGDLGDRLLAALLAGEAAGGDERGIRAAALKVYTTEPYPALDLRADWSKRPLDELAAILEAVRAPDYAGFFNAIPTRAEPDR